MARKSRERRKRRQAWSRHTAPKYAPPGTINPEPGALPLTMQVIAYGPDHFIEQPITDVAAITEHLHRHAVTWVNVDGLGDAQTIRRIGEIFGIHRLALEDVVHVRQRPKVDEYEEHLYMVARMIDRQNGRLGTEQLSMFLGKDYVITFQERPGDCLDAIRRQLREKRGRMRITGPDYLAYCILDSVVDEYFPVLEQDGDRLEALEECVLATPGPGIAAQVHEIRRDLLILRRAMWPQREALNALYRGSSPLISAETRVYFRDGYDHAVQLLDLIEVYRELATSIMELYLTGASHRLNEVIRVLTIISTIFIPLTFIVGIYGMNFDVMPELRSRWGYPIVLLVMAAVAATMLLWFWRRGWLRFKQTMPLDTRGEHSPEQQREAAPPINAPARTSAEDRCDEIDKKKIRRPDAPTLPDGGAPRPEGRV